MLSKLLSRFRRPPANPDRPRPATEQAQRAVAASERSLEKALSRDDAVKEMAAEIRYHRVEVNHIARRMRESMGGH